MLLQCLELKWVDDVDMSMTLSVLGLQKNLNAKQVG